MTIKTLDARGCTRAEIGRLLAVPESTVRYHLKRLAQGAVDRRRRRDRKAAAFATPIAHWVEHLGEGALNLAALHQWLIAEHDYAGSLRSVERYVAQTYPRPAKRARRRVETPPGAQAQVDWAIFPRMVVGGESLTLNAFHLSLSHSRYGAIVWSPRRDQLAWLSCHNSALRRIGGVPAVLRIDNDPAAVARGAGAWGELTDSYRRYAVSVRFHVDCCAPREPRAKGKIERRIRAQRHGLDPTRQAWRDLAELQDWTDATVTADAQRRRCPATGTTVQRAWEHERVLLAPLPRLPEPFDTLATRRVHDDALVNFEGRQYSVPFTLVGTTVELRGCAGRVQILHGHGVVAEHPRHTDRRLLIDPAHYEGPGTARIAPPPPLGRMGRRLQALADTPVEQRPLDLYAALAEVAR